MAIDRTDSVKIATLIFKERINFAGSISDLPCGSPNFEEESSLY
jgi:hypothetical protein